MRIIDTHNHLYFPSFKKDFLEVIQQCRMAGVDKQILIGVDELSCQAIVKLIQAYPDFYGILGLHPCDVDKLGKSSEYADYVGMKGRAPTYKSMADFFMGIEALFLKHPDRIVGFGETGFDRYHRDTPALVEMQKESFERHLDLCMRYDRTLMIHCRSAAKDCLGFLMNRKSKITNCKFVWHCFSEDLGTAKQVLDLGGFIGIGGVLTYPKSEELRDVVAKIPLDRIVTETDAPFLTPYKARKTEKRNSPAYLPEVVALIAELKGMEIEGCAEQLYQNAETCFDLTP